MPNNKQSSHLGAGIVIGTIMGVATGLFLQSKNGKMLVKDAEKKAKKLQGHLEKGLKDASKLTKQKYAELVDKTMDTYVATKEIAEQDIPQIRKFLLGKWKEIEKHVKATQQQSKKS